MTIYEYQCDQDGSFELNLRLGTATESAICPSCGSAAVRVVSAPFFRSKSRAALTAAIDYAEKSRHEPDVVSAVPPDGSRRPTIQLTPKLMGLPRP